MYITIKFAELPTFSGRKSSDFVYFLENHDVVIFLRNFFDGCELFLRNQTETNSKIKDCSVCESAVVMLDIDRFGAVSWSRSTVV